MSSADPFRTLGLKRGASPREVKRAYAKKLKETRPDEDPASFIALREAFERARDMAEAAERQRAWQAEREAREDETVTPAATESEPAKSPHADGVRRKEAKAERRRRRQEIVRALDEWIANGAPDAATGLPAILEGAEDEDRKDLAGVLLERIWEEADWWDGDEWDDPIADTEGDPADLARPSWLDDETILAIHEHLPLHAVSDGAADEFWLARCANRWNALASDVLRRAGRTEGRLPRHPVGDWMVARMERERGDEHGSYFDREKREWVDMSPPARAEREIVALLKAGPGAGRTEAIAAILDRDGLQKLDAYQEIERRLRWWLSRETTGDERDKKGKQRLLVPHWLDREAIDLFDARFGWRDHFGNAYEGEQFERLHRLIDKLRKTGKGPTTPWGRPPPVPDRPWPIERETGPERMPWLLTATGLLASYATLRIVLLPTGWLP